MRHRPVLATLLAAGAVTLLATPHATQAALRVCADPGNMPLSNNQGEGLENRMAVVLARAAAFVLPGDLVQPIWDSEPATAQAAPAPTQRKR